jgi:hypothetical protein
MVYRSRSIFTASGNIASGELRPLFLADYCGLCRIFRRNDEPHFAPFPKKNFGFLGNLGYFKNKEITRVEKGDVNATT